MKSVAMLFAVVCLGSTAFADDRLEEAAKAHYEQGQTLYTAGQFAEARAEFLAGYELSHKPAFLFNAAECARLLNNISVARDGYNEYLRLDPNGKLAMLAMQRLAELGPVTTTPPKPSEPAPAPAPAPAPTMTPPPPTPAPTLTVAPAPVASPMTPSTDLVVHASDRSIPPAASNTAQIERYAGVGLAGTGVALVLTGAIFGYHSSTLSSQVTGACASGCVWSDVSDKDSSARTDATVQWWLYGFGAASVLAGGALYWLGVHEETPVMIAPTAGGAAVSWSGRF
jgi:hypothetical protein